MTPEEVRAQPVKAAERRRRALALRRAGLTYKDIAKALGCSEAHACKMVKREMARIAREMREDAEMILQLELQRLDEAQASIWPQVKQGHLGAIDRLLRIMERRAKLLGLDQVQQPAQPEPRIEIVMPRTSDE